MTGLATNAGLLADSRRVAEADPRRRSRPTRNSSVGSSTEGDEMKIVVIGGTGLVGSKLVERLRSSGHDPLAASPDTGVNTVTGEGASGAAR